MPRAIADLNVRLGFIFDGKSLAAVEKSLQATGAKLSRIGSDLSLTLSAPLAALGVASIKAAGDLESLQNALVSQLGSAEAAKKELELLRQEALKPGLGFEQAVKGSVSLQAVGFSAEFARKTLSEFGNALALAGKGKAELDGVTLALTQISAKGKVSAEEINQIAERLPQIRTLMKQAFGTASTEDIQKLGITAEQFTTAIVSEMSKLPRATGGIKNSIENAGDAVKQFLGTIGNEINKAFNLTDTANSLSASLSKVANSFAALDDGTKRAIVQFGLVVVAVGPLLKVYGALASTLGQVIGVYSSLVSASGRVGTAILSIVGAIKAMDAATRSFVLIGLATAVIAIANNMGLFERELTAAEKAQQLLNQVQKDAVSSIAGEKSAVDTLITTITSEVSSREAKERALEKLKAISPEYFGQLKLENGLVNGLTDSYNRYIGALLNSARAEAAKGKLVEIERQLLELEDGRAQKLKDNIALAKAYGKSAEETTRRESEIYNKQIGELNAKKQALAAVVIQSEASATSEQATSAKIETAGAKISASNKSISQTKRERAEAAKLLKDAEAEEIDQMEKYSKMVRELEQAWLDEAAADSAARQVSLGAIDTSGLGPSGGEQQLQSPGQNVTGLVPPAVTEGQTAISLISEEFTKFNDVYSGVVENVNAGGTVMQQTFLAMGAAMQQAAASGASSFGALAQAAAGAAASVIRSWIQQGVAAAVSKALTTIPFPFNLAAGAAAGAAASALFTKAIGAIGIKGFARGTNNAPGGLAMVGERGPELVNLPRHSQVFSTQQSRRMAASMNGGGSFFGEFILRGQDLALVVERTQRKNQRFR